MKFSPLITITIAFFSLFPLGNINAAHLIGGEMTYEYLGNDRYKIKLQMYRDCQSGGAQFDSYGDNPTIGNFTIYSNNGDNLINIIRMSRPRVEDVELDYDNPCVEIPPNVCVQVGYYEEIVTLPPSDESYIVTYQRCCRNPTIINLIDPGDQGGSYYVEIKPETRFEGYRSPEFRELPSVVICAGFYLDVDLGVEDSMNNTRFEYEFCDPVDGGTRFNPVPNPSQPPPYRKLDYRAPYTTDYPLSANPRLELDPATGRLTGRPDRLGQFVVTVCVSQFRNDTLLSEIRREIQFNVTECEININLEIEGLDSENDTILSCAGQEIDIENVTEDNLGLIQTTEWLILGEDSNQVLNTEDFSYNFPDTGHYNIRLRVNDGIQNCEDSIDFVTELRNPVQADFEIIRDSCYEDRYNITNNSFSENQKIPQYNWFTTGTSGLYSSDRIPELIYDNTGTKMLELIVSDQYGCADTASTEFDHLQFSRDFDINIPRVVCEDRFTKLEALYVPVSSLYDIEWKLNDTVFRGKNIEVKFDSIGLFDVQIVFSDRESNCLYPREFINAINVKETPVSAFNYTPDTLDYFNRDIQFMNESQFANFYNWDFDEGTVSSEENPSYSFQDTGIHKIELISISELGCEDTSYSFIDLPPARDYFLPNAFTPNKDGKNEEFIGVGIPEHIKAFDLRIFTRDGRQVFHSKDPEYGWNGKLNNSNKIFPSGVYLYKLNYTDARNNNYEKSGTVNLIR